MKPKPQSYAVTHSPAFPQAALCRPGLCWARPYCVPLPGKCMSLISPGTLSSLARHVSPLQGPCTGLQPGPLDPKGIAHPMLSSLQTCGPDPFTPHLVVPSPTASDTLGLTHPFDKAHAPLLSLTTHVCVSPNCEPSEGRSTRLVISTPLPTLNTQWLSTAGKIGELFEVLGRCVAGLLLSSWSFAFLLSFLFNLEGLQLQHLHPLYKYFDKWLLSRHAYPKQGHLSFWKATVYSPPTCNAESAPGGGVGGRGSQADCSSSGPELKKRRKGRTAEKALHN